MGNIGSHPGHLSQRSIDLEENHHQWTHSFPRNQPRLHQHKVLPELDGRQKLRHTNNGEILLSGGTLSGRHQNRQILEKNDNKIQTPRSYLANQRDPLHKSGNRYIQDYKYFQNGFKEKMKKFGSEPDLRTVTTSSANQERLRSKKKYKAPPPPLVSSSNLEKSLNWEDNNNSPTIRKARLYKTRADQMKKPFSSPVNNIIKLGTEKNCIEEEETPLSNSENLLGIKSNRLSMPQQIRKTEQNFCEELKEATKRLRSINTTITTKNETNVALEINSRKKEKLKTLDPNINNKEHIRQKLKEIEVAEEKRKQHHANNEIARGDGSGKESSSSPEHTILDQKIKIQQPKTFYFGMDDPLQNDDVIDNFTSNLHPVRQLVTKLINSSESDLSSEIELDYNQISNKNGIDLQLRPILPKKQLEIPRFSPAAAWRLLSAVDSNQTPSTIASDDGPVFIEDKIEKYSRPPPPPSTMQIGSRSNNDKSGDSGISGDAGPTGYDETPDTIINSRTLKLTNHHRIQGISWTPQQDLGDDSSLEEGLNNDSPPFKSRQTGKFSNKPPHVFSLSLPRDNHLSSYMNEKNSPHYSGLQKLKRSVSGVLHNFSYTNNNININNIIKNEFSQSNLSQDQSDNWFLTKSAPNSLNNGFNSLELKNTKYSDENPDLFNQNSGKHRGRVMYLPELDNHDHRSKSVERSRTNLNQKSTMLSKSCENLTITEIKSSSEPEDLQDPPKIVDTNVYWKSYKRPKRFTFQSTVRQIERKRLAEKLSKEAEKKEKQRLRELEAMQRVEEEFQKKRAREKANIRQQLRLFSMDNNTSWSSLPPSIDVKDDIRPEPDGAVSSSTTSSPSLPLHKSQKQSSGIIVSPTNNTTNLALGIKKVYQKNKRSSSSSNNNNNNNNNTNINNNSKNRPSSESSDETKTKAQVTQVLSEYRYPQREYKEYTGSTRYLSEFPENHIKQTTVHPQVTCNMMPKAKGQSSNNKAGSNNYRKDFAHGVSRSTRSAGSTYSEDSQSRNNSPRMCHNKCIPVTRF